MSSGCASGGSSAASYVALRLRAGDGSLSSASLTPSATYGVQGSDIRIDVSKEG